MKTRTYEYLLIKKPKDSPRISKKVELTENEVSTLCDSQKLISPLTQDKIRKVLE